MAVSVRRRSAFELTLSSQTNDPGAAVRAAERTQDLFLDIVARITGPRQAGRYGALLLTSAHGIAGLDLSGHLDLDKWHTNAEELVGTLISLLPKASHSVNG